MKRILASTTILTMMMVAMPALAWHHGSGGDITVTNENDDTDVENTVVVKADTGDNEISGGGSIKTGDAVAFAWLENYVNTNDTKINACGDCGSRTNDIIVTNENDDTDVENTVVVKADTGDNEISGGRHHHHSSGGSIKTGDAYADATVISVVNSSVTRIRR